MRRALSRFRRRWHRRRNTILIGVFVVGMLALGRWWWIPAAVAVAVLVGRVGWWIREHDALSPGRPSIPRSRRRVASARRCAVYRFYGPAGAMYEPWTGTLVTAPGPGRQLLYIGKAVDPARRRDQHAADKPWWPFVDETATIIEWWPSEVAALAAEEAAIRTELPLFNEVHNLANPLRVDW